MNTAQKPLAHGVVLVAGGAIGAGMFALPLVASEAWFGWSLIGLIAVALLTLLAANLLFDVHQQFTPGASFHTLVKTSLGSVCASANNLCIAFIMMILMYAYITAGGRMLGALAPDLPRALLSILFAFLMASIVLTGVRLVSRLSIVFILIMAISFAFVATALIPNLELATLLAPTQPASVLGLIIGIPVFVTAFACGGLVPSLVEYYQSRPQFARLSVTIGLSITLLIYVAWIALNFASLGAESLRNLQAQGAGMSELVLSLQVQTPDTNTKALLRWFSHFAVITSLFSIALGLVHFLIDRFRLATNNSGRGLAVLLAFVPCTLASAVLPYGFVVAIGYAGLLVSISFFLVPAILHIKHFGLSTKSILVGLGGMIAIALKIWTLI